MSNATYSATPATPHANGPRAASSDSTARGGPHARGLDPRRARMVREVGDFGFDWRVAFEAGRLLAAAAIGAILTFALIGHRPSTADTVAQRASLKAGAAAPARVPAAGPEERGEPALLAPLGIAPADAVDTPQRDVHSDGGGH